MHTIKTIRVVSTTTPHINPTMIAGKYSVGIVGVPGLFTTEPAT